MAHQVGVAHHREFLLLTLAHPWWRFGMLPRKWSMMNEHSFRIRLVLLWDMIAYPYVRTGDIALNARRCQNFLYTPEHSNTHGSLEWCIFSWNSQGKCEVWRWLDPISCYDFQVLGGRCKLLRGPMLSLWGHARWMCLATGSRHPINTETSADEEGLDTPFWLFPCLHGQEWRDVASKGPLVVVELEPTCRYPFLLSWILARN